MNDTTAGREVAIYLDTVILRENGWPKQPSRELVALLELLTAVQIKPHIPAVCRFEMRRQWQKRFRDECNAAKQAYEKLADKYRELRRYDASDLPPLILPKEEDEMRVYDRLVREHFDENNYLDVPLPSAPMAQLIQQSAEHLPPFPRDKDEGFRDGVIALSVAEHASTRNLQAVFVTSDKGLGEDWRWKTILADVVLVALDETGLEKIGEVLKTTPSSLARRADVERLEAERKAAIREHEVMVSALRTELNNRFEALSSFVIARVHANPRAVTSLPEGWEIPVDVHVGRIARVRTSDPSATLTAGRHAVTAVVRVQVFFSTRLDKAAIRQIPGLLVPMRGGAQVNHLNGRATVGATVEVDESGAIGDVRFENVAFGDFTSPKGYLTLHG
jgi:hypothetical protein